MHGTCCLFETSTNLAFIVHHAEKVLFSDFWLYSMRSKIPSNFLKKLLTKYRLFKFDIARLMVFSFIYFAMQYSLFGYLFNYLME